MDDSTNATFKAPVGSGINGPGISLNYLTSLNTLAKTGVAEVSAIDETYDYSHKSYQGTTAVRTMRDLRPDTAIVSTRFADTHG